MSRSATIKNRTDNALLRFFRDTRAELSKVTWPTREEGIRLTTIVVIATLIFAIILFGVDSLFAAVIALLIQI